MLDLDSLNREQLEAVLTTEGPLLVLAGAGSGKTRVITFRLAHLLEKGVYPKQILAVTFTNKAAFEMKDRARRMAGKSVRGATISTFHALGAQILRAYPERVGLRAGFTISDAADQLGTLRRILRSLRIDDRRFDVQRIMAAISHAKNAGLDPRRFRAAGGHLSSNDPLDSDEYRVAAIEAYDRYQENLRAQNVVDFDDLLILTVRLLADDSDVLLRLLHRWRYLMIDEYQDTNGAQLELMRLLAGERRNLCVVGDDDQSIYGWRGADVANILSFGEHFPGAKIVKLETNYRSTARILDVANAIISQNPKRFDKRLKPAAEQGDPVRVVSLEDEDTEAQEVTNAILALIAKGTKSSEIAVLFRSNVQSRPFELAFRAAQLRYRVVGGMDLFDRKEIKDALGYLRFLHNADDEQSLRRIINYPPRGIGDTTVARLDDWAREQHLSLLDVLPRVNATTVPDKAAQAITELLATFNTHRKMLRRMKPSTVAKRLFEAAGLEANLFASSDSAATAARRVDNVREILKQIERYESRTKAQAKWSAWEEATDTEADDDDLFESAPVDQDPTLDGFLRDLALGGFEEGGQREDKDEAIVLSTIHAAKGLEWPHVFLVGCEEELLPHRRTLEGDGEIEEERRLAYVAVTRARRHLTLSYALHRARFGKIMPRDRSRFLENLPDDAVVRREGQVKQDETPEEKEAVARDWMQKIRSQLGIKKD